MKRILLLVLAGCIISSTQAQNTDQVRYTVSGGLLGALNLSDFHVTGSSSGGTDYNTQAGWGLGGWVNFPVTSGGSFSVEPQLSFNSLSFKTNSSSRLLLNDGKIRFISVPVLLKFSGKMIGVTVGPQFDFVSSIENNIHTAPEPQESDFKQSNVSLTAGLELFPHGKVTVFGRYIHGLSNMDARAGHSSAFAYKVQNIALGIKLRLFGKKVVTTMRATSTAVVLDSDGDGINDDVDKCPTVFGYAKYDGCPIPDSDGDGIDDEKDKCPTVAGLAKYDGCPIPDSDGDGIDDEKDKCPTVAGLAKYDGCPAPDRDNDGINDDEDKCPDIAGVASNKGCPEVPANVTKSLQASSSNISFGTGAKNITLTGKSNASLDQIVTIMNENPGLSIRVEGHTSNVGDHDANMKLSQDRADAVKAYLVSKGINADRITAEGFGDTMPIGDNKTASGRTKNTRIEIKMAE